MMQKKYCFLATIFLGVSVVNAMDDTTKGTQVSVQVKDKEVQAGMVVAIPENTFAEKLDHVKFTRDVRKALKELDGDFNSIVQSGLKLDDPIGEKFKNIGVQIKALQALCENDQGVPSTPQSSVAVRGSASSTPRVSFAEVQQRLALEQDKSE